MIDNTRVTVIRGGYYHCTPLWNRSKEESTFSPEFGLYLPTKGEATMETIAGKYTLRPGQVYFIPGVHVCAQTCKKEMWVYWMAFVADSFYLHHRLDAIHAVIDFPAAAVPGVADIFARVVEFFEEPRPVECRDVRTEDSRVRKNPPIGLAMQIEAAAMAIAGRLIETSEGDFRWDDDTELKRLKPAIDFMDENYMRNPTLAEIAQIAHFAPNYFHRFFKQHVGITPFKYIENRRLDLARKLLFDQRLNITEIAEQTGYESPYYFSRAFRRRFGMPPSQLRRSP